MIAMLTGQLAYKSLDHVIVDVQGVGYRLSVPLSTFYSLPDEGTVRLHVHTHVREDALLLFGFLTPAEKELFGILLGVSGIGPKVALNLLSHSPAPELAGAIVGGDVKRLSALPGIGKKTAERLILELKDKLARSATLPAATASATAPPPLAVADPCDEALSALVNLGYKETLARKAMESLEISPNASLEDILKGALKVLSR